MKKVIFFTAALILSYGFSTSSLTAYEVTIENHTEFPLIVENFDSVDTNKPATITLIPAATKNTPNPNIPFKQTIEVNHHYSITPDFRAKPFIKSLTFAQLTASSFSVKIVRKQNTLTGEIDGYYLQTISGYNQEVNNYRLKKQQWL